MSIGRGVGAWGDMVVTLNDGSKIEMRSLPRCGLVVDWRRCASLDVPRPALPWPDGHAGYSPVALPLPCPACCLPCTHRPTHPPTHPCLCCTALYRGCRFKEMEAYILQRRDELTGGGGGKGGSSKAAAAAPAAAPKGFA